MTLVYSGLAVGALYALVAMCFNLVLTTSGVFNFAQPQFVMVGAFLAYQGLGSWHLPLVVVLVGCLVVGALLGWGEERFAIRPILARGGHTALIVTVGVGVALEGLARLVWADDPRKVPLAFSERILTIAGGRIQLVELVIIGLAVVLTIGMHVASRRSAWGIAGQAAIEDPDAARLRGVSPARVMNLGFVISGALSVAIGIFAGAAISANLGLGNSLLILGFVALAIGGFGSYLGCLVGGIITGLLQQVIARYQTEVPPLIALFFALLLVLLIRPTGLLGQRKTRAV